MPRKNTSKAAGITKVADRFNPFVSRPSAALSAIVWLDSFEPSLMPRTSRLQGLSGGFGVLTARAVSAAAESMMPDFIPGTRGTRRRFAARALAGGIGATVARLPQVADESLWRSGLRTGGRLLEVAVAGGAVHDVGLEVRARFPVSRTVRPIVMAATTTSGLLIWAGRRLADRTAAVEPWPVEQRSTVPAALASTVVTTAVGTGLARGYQFTRDRWIGYLGPSIGRQVIARAINAALWGLGATSAYNAGVAYIGRANAKVEPGYSQPPATPLVSGGPESVSPFEQLGQQGRRFVTDTLTPDLISSVMGEPATAHPIRVFVGFDSEPLYQSGRAELALEELERTNAYDRGYLLLVSPTGTGWMDQTVVESAEFLARGDIATLGIQYGRFPSFLSLQKVALGKAQFRLLLMGVKERLRERPPERRPKVLVFGESLGAWTSSDVLMFQGVDGFDHYGIDRALWVGLPGLAKWSRNGMARGQSELVPPGTVRVIDRAEELEGVDRDPLRAVILSHDNDPIAQLSPDLLVRRPDWLGDERGRGVPEAMVWRPLVTFWQTVVDAANAMVTVPGEFRSFGHDYRADLASTVARTFDLPPVTQEQLAAVDAALRRLELERAERIKADTHDESPPPPIHRSEADGVRITGGVPLRAARTPGARWNRGRRAAVSG